MSVSFPEPTSQMRKIVAGVLVAALVVAVGAASYWAGSRGTAPASSAAAPAPKAAPPGVIVEAARVQVMSLPQAITAVGSLRSDETIIVRPEIAGRVARIQFREGEHVDKDAVLVKLDDSVQQADVQRARANLTLSKTKHERAIDLRDKGFLSSQALDESENNLRVAQADAELMEARSSKTTIRAPFAGTIGLRQVSIGDYVKEGQDIVNLESLDPLKVDFRIPELALSQVRDGQTLQITLDALPDRAYDGRVYAINPLIDANGRAILIRAHVPNRDGKLRPGMFARVRLFTSGSKDTLVVPEESLFPVGDDKYVYKVVEGKAQRQKIEIGARRDGRVEVVNGLTPADVVVTAGVIKLREGVAVQVANTPPASGTKPAMTDTPQKKG
jgi:membrane fusion protein (multidrug efflux system)